MSTVAFACGALAIIATPAGAVEIVTVTASPLSGGAVNDTAASQTLDAGDLDRFGQPSLLGAASRGLAGVSLADAQDNPFQPSLFYRGFEASALVGDAQGLAVYLDGVRFNQSFGDTVEWSLIPDGAIARLTLAGSDPVFGLNALGGSLSLALKDGSSDPGLALAAEGGSFGHGEAFGSWSGSDGNQALFVAADALHDDGWRQHSPSSLARAFAKWSWRDATSEVHLDVLAAANDLTGNGTSPVELLAARRNAVFTWPDNTRNLFGLVSLGGGLQPSDEWTLAGNFYISGLRRRTANGDASDAAPCDPPDGLLCLDDGSVLTDTVGNPIPDFLAGAPYAQLNRTRTATLSFGGALQAAYRLDAHTRLLAGLSVDGGHTDFSATSAIGALTADRGFAGPGTVIAQPNLVIAPVKVAADNTYAGFYVEGVFDVTQALKLRAAARYNIASIALKDGLGTALNGHHAYTRLDPSAGVVYRFAAGLAAHFGYAEANRAPTPAEFSCADAAAPCSLTNFFVGDPALKQVVARTFDTGLRGTVAAFAWALDAWRTDSSNDILFTASSVPGRAFFRNIGATRREGIEANADWHDGRWSLSADYSFTRATFQSVATLNSPDNPLADADGHIFVVPGNRLPGIPEHLAKLEAGFALAPDADVSLDLRYATGVYLQGDESNLNPPTHPYLVVDAGTRWRLAPGFEAYLTVDNLFDRRYETFGAFSPTDDVPIMQVPGASDPRSLSPAAPRSILAGLRWHG